MPLSEIAWYEFRQTIKWMSTADLNAAFGIVKEEMDKRVPPLPRDCQVVVQGKQCKREHMHKGGCRFGGAK